MERLSSCYFCGTALDAPLEEYPVVPRELDPEAGARITLCPTCRRKLGEVVERVVDAAGAEAATDDRPGDEREADAGESAPEEDTSPDDAEPTGAGAGGIDTIDAPGSDDDEGTHDKATTGDGEDDQSVTALEHNRVMRLLENRELPVEKAEFAAIATQAYDVSRSDVDAIVAAAEERGLLAVEDGRLVRPGE